MTKEELLERGDETVTLRQLVERFEAVEEEYSGVPWTLKQIYQQIDMLVSKRPCTDAISREKALQIIRAWFDREATPSDLKNEIEQLPPVTAQPKIGHWIKCIDDNGSSYYLCSACRCGEDCKFDWCPNCGSDNKEMEE